MAKRTRRSRKPARASTRGKRSARVPSRRTARRRGRPALAGAREGVSEPAEEEIRRAERDFETA